MTPLLEFNRVTVVRKGRRALDDVTFKVERGENVAILGPNGCGKSTLVKTIARDLYPFAGSGTVRIGGQDRGNLFDLRKTLGIVSNELQSQCERDVIALDVVVSGFFGSLGELRPYTVTDRQRKEALERLLFVEAEHLADRNTDELSSGESRRVLIARALVNAPSALLLDEPTTSLDMRSAHQLICTLRKIATSGMNVILVTHHVEEIFPEIRRVILLSEGRVFLDGPTEAVMTSKNLSELYKAPVFLERICGVYRARLEADN